MVRWIVLVLALLAPQAALAAPNGRVAVVDGDTIEVGGTRVRLYGIDAPELSQTCLNENGQSWRCGAWAADEVRRRFQGRQARCRTLDTDRYGRAVARCSVAGQDMGAEIVRSGLAQAYRRYSLDYVDAEKAAAFAGRGIFASRFAAPEAYRATPDRTRAAQAAPSGCRIKGNISSNGRIYHVPGQAFYAETRITPSRGERWFCTEAEARAAGWRRARR